MLYWLAIERELIMGHPIVKDEVMEAVHSLGGRSLVECGKRGAAFTLQPIVLEYVTERIVALVSEEIRASRPELFRSCQGGPYKRKDCL